MDHQRQCGTWRALTLHVKGFGAVDAQRLARGAGLELQRQHTHADEVGAMDAFEALGHDHLHPRQAHALGRPVA